MAITALSHFEAVCLLHSLCSSDGNFFQFTSSHHSTDFSFFLYQYLIRNRMKKPLSSFLLLQSDYWLLTSPIMAFSSCLCNSQILLKIDHSRLSKKLSGNIRKDQFITFALKDTNTDLFGQHAVSMRSKLKTEWSFKGGSRTISGPNIQRFVQHRKSFGVYASWFTNPQIASSVFTLGTVAVLPFYTLMVLAPKAELTKKSIESAIPYVVLGLLYAFLLYLSWTPDTIRLMFASQYWLPELSGIAKMFSSEMTLASAWIHLLAVDLFAARQVFHDGLENNVETRHSVSLCLLFCPIGIAVHVFTKALTTRARNTKREIH